MGEYESVTIAKMTSVLQVDKFGRNQQLSAYCKFDTAMISYTISTMRVQLLPLIYSNAHCCDHFDAKSHLHSQSQLHCYVCMGHSMTNLVIYSRGAEAHASSHTRTQLSSPSRGWGKKKPLLPQLL